MARRQADAASLGGGALMSFAEIATPIRRNYANVHESDWTTFLCQCIDHARVYRRLVPQFEESVPAIFAPPLARFVVAGGHIRLITTTPLNSQQKDAAQKGSDCPAEALRLHPIHSPGDLEHLFASDAVLALSWLVARRSLSLRFVSWELAPLLGFFTDEQEEHIRVANSGRVRQAGFFDVTGSVEVAWSWGDPRHRVAEQVERFDRIWNGEKPNWQQPAESKTPVLIARGPSPNLNVAESPSAEAEPKKRDNVQFAIPPHIELRDYQNEAIRQWLNQNGRGILAMATGTGKTLTALCLASKVAESNPRLVVIVVCPFLNLASQWIGEMSKFGLTPIPAFGGRAQWEQSLQEAYQRIAVGLTENFAVVVSNATFLSPAFQSALRPALGHHLLIADEVHNLGARHLKNVLPEGISMRLGLSATPERYGDVEGTQAIFDYFGQVVYEFGIEKAIKEGVLVPYRYHPVLIDLTDDEADEYRDLTGKIARAWAKTDDDNESNQLKMLLIKRARLLGSAANKLPALRQVLRALDAPIEKALIYCGDGTVECPITAQVDRQILAVTRLLGDDLRLRVRRFTSDESAEERDEILASLRSGGLQALVAIRCLDEGIDLPDVRLGFLLASSTNPRQFIQRRGRLLRRAPGKERAIIYDFIVRPPDLGGSAEDSEFNLERNMFKRELTRILEFCQAAENGPTALQQLQSLRLTYNLLTHRP